MFSDKLCFFSYKDFLMNVFLRWDNQKEKFSAINIAPRHIYGWTVLLTSTSTAAEGEVLCYRHLQQLSQRKRKKPCQASFEPAAGVTCGGFVFYV